MSFSSDLQATAHNFETLLRGASTFSEFVADEGSLVEGEIAKLPAAAQSATTLLFDSLKAGASALVGAGQTAFGPILAENTDTQTTQLLNLLGTMGVPTGGIYGLAEHAALITAINGLKAGLDRIGIHLTLANGVSASPPAKAA